MTRNVRTYDHVCAVARALERVGDRWSLLVIRDLLTGPKRFTDLMDRLGGITPATLTQRLRELEDGGILSADRQPGRREVWYSLTPAGADLAPVIDGLSWWGLRHAWRWPKDGEPLHAEHLLRSATRAIDHSSRDHQKARWHFRLDGTDYVVQSDGHHWSLTAMAPSGPVDVTITGTTRSLAAYIFSGSDAGLDISGEPKSVRRFRRLIPTMAAVVSPGQPEDATSTGHGPQAG